MISTDNIYEDDETKKRKVEERLKRREERKLLKQQEKLKREQESKIKEEKVFQEKQAKEEQRKIRKQKIEEERKKRESERLEREEQKKKQLEIDKQKRLYTRMQKKTLNTESNMDSVNDETNSNNLISSNIEETSNYLRYNAKNQQTKINAKFNSERPKNTTIYNQKNLEESPIQNLVISSRKITSDIQRKNDERSKKYQRLSKKVIQEKTPDLYNNFELTKSEEEVKLSLNSNDKKNFHMKNDYCSVASSDNKLVGKITKDSIFMVSPYKKEPVSATRSVVKCRKVLNNDSNEENSPKKSESISPNIYKNNIYALRNKRIFSPENDSVTDRIVNQTYTQSNRITPKKIGFYGKENNHKEKYITPKTPELVVKRQDDKENLINEHSNKNSSPVKIQSFMEIMNTRKMNSSRKKLEMLNKSSRTEIVHQDKFCNYIGKAFRNINTSNLPSSNADVLGGNNLEDNVSNGTSFRLTKEEKLKRRQQREFEKQRKEDDVLLEAERKKNEQIEKERIKKAEKEKRRIERQKYREDLSKTGLTVTDNASQFSKISKNYSNQVSLCGIGKFSKDGQKDNISQTKSINIAHKYGIRKENKPYYNQLSNSQRKSEVKDIIWNGLLRDTINRKCTGQIKTAHVSAFNDSDVSETVSKSGMSNFENKFELKNEANKTDRGPQYNSCFNQSDRKRPVLENYYKTNKFNNFSRTNQNTPRKEDDDSISEDDFNVKNSMRGLTKNYPNSDNRNTTSSKAIKFNPYNKEKDKKNLTSEIMIENFVNKSNSKSHSLIPRFAESKNPLSLNIPSTYEHAYNSNFSSNQQMEYTKPNIISNDNNYIEIKSKIVLKESNSNNRLLNTNNNLATINENTNKTEINVENDKNDLKNINRQLFRHKDEDNENVLSKQTLDVLHSIQMKIHNQSKKFANFDNLNITEKTDHEIKKYYKNNQSEANNYISPFKVNRSEIHSNVYQKFNHENYSKKHNEEIKDKNLETSNIEKTCLQKNANILKKIINHSVSNEKYQNKFESESKKKPEKTTNLNSNQKNSDKKIFTNSNSKKKIWQSPTFEINHFFNDYDKNTNLHLNEFNLEQELNKVINNIQDSTPVVSNNNNVFQESNDLEKNSKQNSNKNLDNNCDQFNDNKSIKTSKSKKKANREIVIPDFNVNFDPDIYIKKFIDKKDSFGFIYVLINGVIGINFNDGLKILCNLESNNCLVIRPITNTSSFLATLYEISNSTTTKIPKDLESKLHFIKETKDILRKDWYKLNLLYIAGHNHLDQRNYIFVKEWMISKQCTIFKFNNSIYQAVFVDHSEFLMSSSAKAVVYIAKDRKRYTFNIRSENLYKNRSISTRLEYFKSMLRKWINCDDHDTVVTSK